MCVGALIRQVHAVLTGRKAPAFRRCAIHLWMEPGAGSVAAGRSQQAESKREMQQQKKQRRNEEEAKDGTPCGSRSRCMSVVHGLAAWCSVVHHRPASGRGGKASRTAGKGLDLISCRRPPCPCPCSCSWSFLSHCPMSILSPLLHILTHLLTAGQVALWSPLLCCQPRLDADQARRGELEPLG